MTAIATVMAIATVLLDDAKGGHGAEVDLLICRGNNILYALEIKSSQNIAKESLTGLNSFINDNPEVPVYVLGEKQNRRQLNNGATILNWNEFILEELLKI